MAIDINLVKAIRDGGYDAWQETETLSPSGKGYSLPKYEDPKLDYVRTSGGASGGWRSIISWDLGKLRDPSAIVALRWRLIETGRNRVKKLDPTRDAYVDYCKESYMTPVFQLIYARDFREDYCRTIERIRAGQEAQKLECCSLVFDATGVGVAVDEQLRHLQGFTETRGMCITGGDVMQNRGMFTSLAKSRMLSDLEQVVTQKRLRTPEGLPDIDKLREQLIRLNVEETASGHYRTSNQQGQNHHSDQMMSLCMGVSWGEYIGGRFRQAKAF